MEGWYESIPDSLDTAADLQLVPEDAMKLITFLDAFASGRVETYDYRDPVTNVDFKGAIRTTFEEYLNRYPERELTDVFQTVVILTHQPILPKQIYTAAGVQDLDFRDMWQEQTDSFTREVATYYSGIFSYVQYKTGNPETAANLTQEVFESAWRERNTYDPRTPFNFYLRKLAHNRVTDHYRLHTSREPEAPVEIVDMGVPATSLFRPRPTIESEMERQYDIALVRQAIARLDSFDDRELVRMRYWERQRFEAIASALGKTTEAARQQHARLLKKLRGTIEGIWRQESQPGSEKVVWTLDPDDF